MLKEFFRELAIKHPTRKFMQIQADKCAEGFQDADVPCLLFYSSGQLLDNISGQRCRDMFGGKRMTCRSVEFVLAKECKFLDVEFQEDPRDSLKTFNAYVHRKKAFLGKDEDESGSEGEDDREYINNQLFRYKHKTK